MTQYHPTTHVFVVSKDRIYALLMDIVMQHSCCTIVGVPSCLHQESHALSPLHPASSTPTNKGSNQHFAWHQRTIELVGFGRPPSISCDDGEEQLVIKWHMEPHSESSQFCVLTQWFPLSPT
jgi:hypothetical protein